MNFIGLQCIQNGVLSDFDLPRNDVINRVIGFFSSISILWWSVESQHMIGTGFDQVNLLWLAHRTWFCMCEITIILCVRSWNCSHLDKGKKICSHHYKKKNYRMNCGRFEQYVSVYAIAEIAIDVGCSCMYVQLFWNLLSLAFSLRGSQAYLMTGIKA